VTDSGVFSPLVPESPGTPQSAPEKPDPLTTHEPSHGETSTHREGVWVGLRAAPGRGGGDVQTSVKKCSRWRPGTAPPGPAVGALPPWPVPLPALVHLPARVVGLLDQTAWGRGHGRWPKAVPGGNGVRDLLYQLPTAFRWAQIHTGGAIALLPSTNLPTAQRRRTGRVSGGGLTATADRSGRWVGRLSEEPEPERT